MTRHFSMLRDFHLADLFTLLNGACGTAAIFLAMSHIAERSDQKTYAAGVFVVLALVFDVMDGRVARWRHTASAMGRELDSLADVISFGVAPAALAFGTGLDGGWDAFVLMYFVACGVSRLARYNITAEALAADESGKVKYFEGTPIPTSVLLVGLMALAAWKGHVGDAVWGGALQFAGCTLHPLVLLYLVSGSLMISKTLRIPKL